MYRQILVGDTLARTSSLVRPSLDSRRVARFGAFELDLSAGELRKDKLKIRLQGQPFQVLALLLENPGEVVSREELRQKLWPADTFVDFDKGLNTAINKIREALCDSAEKPRYVETLPRRGYRFLHPLEAAVSQASIAVLPFVSLSADPENEIFADGMSEEIISALMQIKNLRVAGRTSSFSFKGKYADLRAIGEQLNVRTVLEGSVRKSGNRLRITAQLVNTTDGYHLWSERYDREMQDVFAVQEEIAKSIAQRLEVTLDSERQPLLRAGTDNLEAFKCYLQGRGLFFQRGPRLLPAVEHFKKAVALDPRYALAWASLADAGNMLGFYGLAPPAACLPQAKKAAEQAVALDPLLAQAHNSLSISHLFNWDRQNAESEFLRSLELKHADSYAQSWYGLYYLQWVAGRLEEGLSQAQQAVRMDPLSAYGWAIQSFAYLLIDIDKALESAQETLRLDPDSFLGRWAHLSALSLQGCFAEAAEVGESALAASGRSAWIIGSLARTYAHLGKRTNSEALYMELKWRSKREHVAPVVLAWAARAAGERDEAIQLVRESVRIGDPGMIAAKYWPDFAELREDPRFAEILTSLGWE